MRTRKNRKGGIMTREELKALGIDGETLEKVMALHGKDVEKYKG